MAKILIIDDDGIVRDALTVFLTRAGHEVQSAEDGISGLRIFKSSQPDLVVLDRDLPGLRGSSVLAKIRETDTLTKVLILTGFDAPEDVEQYLKSGATAFLSKGDGLSNVLAQIDILLGAAPVNAPKPSYKPPPRT